MLQLSILLLVLEFISQLLTIHQAKVSRFKIYHCMKTLIAVVQKAKQFP
jgi:hypothetical protein